MQKTFWNNFVLKKEEAMKWSWENFDRNVLEKEKKIAGWKSPIIWGIKELEKVNLTAYCTACNSDFELQV